MSERETESRDFIRQIVADDLASGKHQRIITRFPPEPNGYLHIGHAKSICLNFGIALEYEGRCHLRFDDTNPAKEDAEFVESIQTDVRWLGFDWGEHLYFASDYFDQLYKWAVGLIESGKAYVDEQTPEEISRNRGNLQEPGVESPFRDRPAEESLDLFRRMKEGEFRDGEKVLRARIDMAHPNLNLRDPVLYRIARAHHHRTGDAWCIYPMYDFTHGQSDALEHITHSLCTLEFEHHRPLYEWFLDNLSVPSRPRQIEFARLNLTYTVMSKRKLLELVNGRHVTGWDDPRMPTLSGMRRRGYPAEAIRNFCHQIGVTKYKSTHDFGLLENAVRHVLNRDALRFMAVLDPLRVVISNYPENEVEEMEAVRNPENPDLGTRLVPFCRELFIERADFMEDPPKKFFRLKPGGEVRLRCAYFVKCDEVIKNEAGEIVELRCTYDPRDARRRESPGRTKGQRNHPLGERASRRRSRGPPLRTPFPGGESRRGRGLLPRKTQSRFSGGGENRKTRTRTRRNRSRPSGPIRKTRLFLRRCRREPRQARFQPYRGIARFVGKEPVTPSSPPPRPVHFQNLATFI